MDPPPPNMYFSDVTNEYTNVNTANLVNPTVCYDGSEETCPYSNQRLCSQACPSCAWCVDSSKRGRCIPLKDFTQSNCPNSYKTEQFRNNGLNTLVALSIAIMIILFLGLIYNGKRR